MAGSSGGGPRRTASEADGTARRSVPRQVERQIDVTAGRSPGRATGAADRGSRRAEVSQRALHQRGGRRGRVGGFRQRAPGCARSRRAAAGAPAGGDPPSAGRGRRSRASASGGAGRAAGPGMAASAGRSRSPAASRSAGRGGARRAPGRRRRGCRRRCRARRWTATVRRGRRPLPSSSRGRRVPGCVVGMQELARGSNGGWRPTATIRPPAPAGRGASGSAAAGRRPRRGCEQGRGDGELGQRAGGIARPCEAAGHFIGVASSRPGPTRVTARSCRPGVVADQQHAARGLEDGVRWDGQELREYPARYSAPNTSTSGVWVRGLQRGQRLPWCGAAVGHQHQVGRQAENRAWPRRIGGGGGAAALAERPVVVRPAAGSSHDDLAWRRSSSWRRAAAVFPDSPGFPDYKAGRAGGKRQWPSAG